MTTYSTQLFSGELSAAANVYVAPSSNTIVVRDVELWNAGSAAADIAVNLMSPSGSYVAGIITAKAVPANGTAQWDGRVVMLPGQMLFANATGWPIGIVISGYTLT